MNEASLILLFSKTSYSQTFSTPIPAINPWSGSGGIIGTFTKMMVVNGKPAICYLDHIRTSLNYVHALDADGTAWGPGRWFGVAAPERSADGKNFTKVGTVAAVNAVYSHNYSFTDASPLEGTNYYRLRIEEESGMARYSTIVSLRSKNATGRQVSVYPNPVKNNTLQFETKLPAGDYKLKIVNSAGMAVMCGVYQHGGWYDSSLITCFAKYLKRDLSFGN